MSTYSIEVVRKIYNNNRGEYVAVCPDCDGNNLVEITSDSNTIVLHPEEAVLVAAAIQACAEELMAKAER